MKPERHSEGSLPTTSHGWAYTHRAKGLGAQSRASSAGHFATEQQTDFLWLTAMIQRLSIKDFHHSAGVGEKKQARKERSTSPQDKTHHESCNLHFSGGQFHAQTSPLFIWHQQSLSFYWPPVSSTPCTSVLPQLELSSADLQGEQGPCSSTAVRLVAAGRERHKTPPSALLLKAAERGAAPARVSSLCCLLGRETTQASCS